MRRILNTQQQASLNIKQELNLQLPYLAIGLYTLKTSTIE
jgi:hypothetical protein